jgi:NADH-quinone oxidoreductase subunit K
MQIYVQLKLLSYIWPSNLPSMQSIVQAIPLEHYLFLCITLFCIGITGVLIRRNAIIIFMSVELMLNSINLLLSAFSTYKGDANGQVFVFFIMAVAAAEVAVGLAIIVMIFRNIKSVDIHILNKLKF